MTTFAVVYQSRRGHTRTIAEEIGKVLEVEPIDIHVPSVLPKADLLFVGMGIYGGKVDQDLLDYLEHIPCNTIKGAAVFSTSASGKDRMELAINILKHKGVQIYPKHLCLKGQFMLMNKGFPDANEKAKARAFALEVMQSFQG